MVNITGTCDDCFNWAVVAGMHPVDANANRMSKYAKYFGKYNFSSLRSPDTLSFIVFFA